MWLDVVGLLEYFTESDILSDVLQLCWMNPTNTLEWEVLDLLDT